MTRIDVDTHGWRLSGGKSGPPLQQVTVPAQQLIFNLSEPPV